MMDRRTVTAGMLALAGCAATGDIGEEALPTAPPGPPLPDENKVLQKLAFGSCQTAERPIPILQRVVAERADLMVFMGDNVYGDARTDMGLPELKAQYALLAAHPDFTALRAATPTVAVYDDHDFGANDGGGDFPGRDRAKTLFNAFWRPRQAQKFRDRDGVYDVATFGPRGRRTQIILLDTRFGRTPLKTKPDSDRSLGRYVPTDDPGQQMLSPAQWRWLEAALRQPADLRFVISSIQVMADGHGWECWRTMPLEQARLFDMIRQTGARGVVFVSGDRHAAGLYRRADLLPSQTLYELTASSLNRPGNPGDEQSSGQIGAMYGPINYGTASIDWSGRQVSLQVHGDSGAPVRSVVAGFADLGLV